MVGTCSIPTSSSHFANDPAIKDKLAKENEVFIPCIALGELFFGAHKSGREQGNLSRINDFAANSIVLVCDQEAARRYGEIKNGLRTKGRPIPENDIWIAAIAFQYELTLVTRDTHYGEIENLTSASW